MEGEEKAGADGPELKERRPLDGRAPAGRRRTLGALMGAVACLAVVFAATRPFWTPATVRAARAVLVDNSRALGPGYNPDHFQVASVSRAAPGWWHVRFVRVAGAGNPECLVSVPDGAVRRARFRPW